MSDKISIDYSESNIDNMMPMSGSAALASGRSDKTGADTFGTTGLQGMLGSPGMNMGAGPNISRVPARRFYDPEMSTTAIYLPREHKTKNRWNRWFCAHDELIGTVIDFHSEMPYSQAEIVVDDHAIKRHFEDCFDDIQFFSRLPEIDREFMQIGEVFLNTPWDNTKGQWSHIIPLNPDFVDVKFSPFADQDSIIELIPDDELKKIVHSSKPEDQQLKKRIPQEILKRVLSGRNILLNPEEVTHIARKLHSYDVRGTSIVQKLWRCYVPGTGVRMSDGTLKNIEDVKVGDKVLSIRGEERDVLDNVHYDIDGEVTSIRLQNTDKWLTSTPDHKYMLAKQVCSCGCGQELTKHQIIRGFNYIQGHVLKDTNTTNAEGKTIFRAQPTYTYDKMPIKDAKEYNYALVPISQEVRRSELNEDLSRMIGYYLAEGYMSTSSKDGKILYGFAFGYHEINTWVKDTIDILRNELGIIGSVQLKKSVGSAVVLISRKDDVVVFNSFIRKYVIGNYSYTKELTPDFIYYEKDNQVAMLIGYFRGDGSKYPTGKYCAVTTVSLRLAEQVQWILLRNEFFAAIRTKFEERDRFIIKQWCHCRKAYEVYMSGQFSKKFMELCWDVDFDKYNKSTAAYTKVKELYTLGVSYTKIAKYLNDNGFVGCEGGKFYASTIKVIIKNDGYDSESYSYDLNSIKIVDNNFLVPIVEIKTLPYKGRVHDITVDVDHWWLAQDGAQTANTLMYEDKLKEAQLTIADSMIYPLKIFKLGDPNKGWIPNSSHQQALAQMLQQATFDPNFSLIYHYGLSVDYVTVADKVMQLGKEWQEINNRKMVGLGISAQFLSGDSSYATASVGMQMQLSRYKAKRDLFEIRWVKEKLFKGMAERNDWYRRDKKEIAGQYRISRSGEEKDKRLIIPELSWHKKLMLRDDQAFQTFLNNVYAQGKGPISAMTLLESMGYAVEDELRKKKAQKGLEQKVGEFIQQPAPGAPGGGAAGGLPGGAPLGSPPPAAPGAPAPGGAKAFFKTLFKQAKPIIEVDTKVATVVEELVSEESPELTSDTFTGNLSKDKKPVVEASLTNNSAVTKEQQDMIQLLLNTEPIPDKVWLHHASSPTVPVEIAAGLHKVHNKLLSFNKKYPDDHTAFAKERDYILKAWQDVYVQGKLASYETTNFLSIYNQYYAQDGQLKDYSDIVICNEFSTWYDLVHSAEMTFNKKASKIRSLSTVCFALGQLKGYQEQGINNVRLSNTITHDGLHYAIPDLQKHGINLDNFIAANGEIAIFVPCIEGYDDEEFGNSIDPQIQRYSDFICNDIMVKGCPIEFSKSVQKVIGAASGYLKDKYSSIKFVLDVIDLPEWEATQKKAYQKELGNSQDSSLLITEKISLDKLQKRATVATFVQGDTLFVSNWIGMEEVPFTTNFINHLGFLQDEVILKKVSKIYKPLEYNLTQDEIETYKVFNYIDPVLDDSMNCRGYKVSFKNVDNLPNKLKVASTWGVDGKCLTDVKQNGYNVFATNLRNWIDYPHKIDQSLHYLFKVLQ